MKPMKNKTVILVEDDPDLQESIGQIIRQLPGLDLIKMIGDGLEAVKIIPDLHPDLIFMDINLPGCSGIECCSTILAENPEILILMLTSFEDDDSVFNSLKAGATGYLIKKDLTLKLQEAVEDLLSGGSPMSPSIARRVVNSFKKTEPAQNQKLETLTAQEEKVLHLLSKGYQYREIANELFISAFTVKTHLRNIYRKLQVRSGTEAILKLFNKPS